MLRLVIIFGIAVGTSRCIEACKESCDDDLCQGCKTDALFPSCEPNVTCEQTQLFTTYSCDEASGRWITPDNKLSQKFTDAGCAYTDFSLICNEKDPDELENGMLS